MLAVGSRAVRWSFRFLGRSLLLSAIFTVGSLLGWAGQPPQTSVTLAWELALDDDVIGYRLYYGGESQTYTNAVSVGNATEVTIEPLIPGATYYFSVAAVGQNGLESDFSNEVTYTVPGMAFDPFDVQIESAGVVSAGDTATARLQWSPARIETLGYLIYLGERSTVYSQTIWVSAPATEFEINELQLGATYYFAVSVISIDGTEGPLSREMSVTAPPPSLPVVEPGLEVIPGSGTSGEKLLIFWPDVAASGYVVDYGTASGEHWNRVVAEPGATEVILESLVPGQTYHIVVRAVSDSGFSGPPSEELVHFVPLSVAPRISLERRADGVVVLSGSAPPETVFEVLTSVDNTHWEVAGIVMTGPSGEISHVVTPDPSEPQRFYKLRWTAPGAGDGESP